MQIRKYALNKLRVYVCLRNTLLCSSYDKEKGILGLAGANEERLTTTRFVVERAFRSRLCRKQ